MKHIIIITVLLFTLTLGSARNVRFSIVIPDTSRVEMIISVELEKFGFSNEDNLSLYYDQGKKKIIVPSQVEGNRLWWIMEAPVLPGTKWYELSSGKTENQWSAMQLSDLDGKLTVHLGTQELLTYQAATVYPPPGVDTVFKRSGFIHPLRSPHGQYLTLIQPKDHYHHYGIWNPWTHVLFEGDTIDFWNLGYRQGAVRFAGLTRKFEGPVFSGYEVLHEHVVFKRGGTEVVALNELQEVRVYRPATDRYLVDITIRYRCAGSSPFHILAYRYAGLGWRATEGWNDTNSGILTSEGKDRSNADGSLARWFVYQGQLGNDYGGMEMMSSPANFNHPEPLRIWPPGMNGRGDVFANFAPAKTRDWLLEPGKHYALKYRFLVFNGKLDADAAEECWRAFAGNEYAIELKKD
ncbi:MAG: PmoA family protein [Bacteroidales bacterium]